MTTSSALANLHARLVTRLGEARRAAKLTQVELAKRLEWQQVYVSRIETGERKLGVDEYVAVALAIGVDPGGVVKKVKLAAKRNLRFVVSMLPMPPVGETP